MPAKSYTTAKAESEPSRLDRQLLFRPAMLLAISEILLSFLLASCTSTPPNDPASVVQAGYDRLNAGDVDGFMEFVSDNAVFLGSNGGKHAGSQAIRDMLEAEFASGNMRVELSDVRSDGNMVTYAATIYIGQAVIGEYSDGLDIVADGKITFEGRETWRRYYCDQDPSLVFCPAD
jgi:ketosteroid isomerase-like protein